MCRLTRRRKARASRPSARSRERPEARFGCKGRVRGSPRTRLAPCSAFGFVLTGIVLDESCQRDDALLLIPTCLFPRATMWQALARVAKAAEDLQCRYSEVKYWATTSIGCSLISRYLIRARQCGVRSAPRRWTILKASMM